MFTLTLSDGSTISNLTLNSNTLISSTPVTAEMFSGKLSHVVIEGTDDEGLADMEVVGEHNHMELVALYQVDSEWYICLRDLSEAELKEAKTQADIAYLSMMTGVDLD